MSIYNFSAGPAMLPADVMVKAQSELLNWSGQGCSVMEVSHRSKEFIAVYDSAVEKLNRLLGLDENYTVLFMHGGGRGQFSAVPLNLLNGGKANYVQSGSWSKAAFQEAQKFGQPINQDVVINNDQGLKTVLPFSEWQVDSDSQYIHYCPNETVDGIEIFAQPKFDIPVVADMSSTILSRTIDINCYDVIYAGAQKNIGPSGLSIVIIRKELLQRSPDTIPSVFNYAVTAANDSMFNTPATFAIYLAELVFDWLLNQGGVAAIEQQNIRKAELLYSAIDNSGFYTNHICPENRSRMNVPFLLADANLDKLFLQQAFDRGLHALQGHRSVGGMRASIYNAMPLAGVQALVEFMQEFEKRHG